MQEKIINTKICKQCNSNFEITDKDMEFYEKVSPIFVGKKYNISVPTLCPDCRLQKRLSFRNIRKLYKAKSSLSGKDILSMYNPESGYKVYHPDEWWGDKWNPLDYGFDFDFNKTFFEQFNILLKNVPIPSLSVVLSTIENSDYINGANNTKDSYLSFNLTISEKIFYSEAVNYSKNIIDCYSLEKAENCYECINCKEVMNCFFSYNISNSSGLIYCSNSEGINNCIGCINLFNKSYCIFNKQYSKEEYLSKKQELLKDLQELDSLARNFFKTQIKKENLNLNSENSSGEYLTNTNNCNNCFNCINSENLKHCFYIKNGCENSYDLSLFGNHISFSYESCIIGNNSNKCLFCFGVYSNVSDLIYCIYCANGTNNCFGCVGLVAKQYCIFNKQYTKDEYEILVPKIIEYMKKTGEWGEYFPSLLSPFGYNESTAIEQFPLSKEEAIDEGFKWNDYETPFPKVKKIIPASKLPNNIKEIPDDILNWAIECEVTNKPFRIIKQELEFYRKYNLPIPKKHPDQRYLERLSFVNKRKLYERKCDKCHEYIKTTYSPEREEIVYCEECYNGEVY